LSDDDDCVCDGGHKTRFSGQFKRQTLTFGLNALSQHFEVRLNESLDKSKGGEGVCQWEWWRGERKVGKRGKAGEVCQRIGRKRVFIFFRPATAFGHKQPA